MRRIIEIIRGTPNWSKLRELREDGAAIIDVRSRESYEKGHIKGAIHIPFRDLGWKVQDIKALGKPIITCCGDGKWSRPAARVLRRLGIKAFNGGPWTELETQLHLN